MSSAIESRTHLFTYDYPFFASINSSDRKPMDSRYITTFKSYEAIEHIKRRARFEQSKAFVSFYKKIRRKAGRTIQRVLIGKAADKGGLLELKVWGQTILAI